MSASKTSGLGPFLVAMASSSLSGSSLRLRIFSVVPRHRNAHTLLCDLAVPGDVDRHVDRAVHLVCAFDPGDVRISEILASRLNIVPGRMLPSWPHVLFDLAFHRPKSEEPPPIPMLGLLS